MNRIRACSALIFSVLVSASCCAAAKEAVFERKHDIKSAKPAVMADHGGTVWWQGPDVMADGATSIRLLFTKVSIPAKQDVDLVVYDKDDKELERIRLASPMRGQTVFTRRFFGTEQVRASIESKRKPVALSLTFSGYFLGPDTVPEPLSMVNAEPPWDVVSGDKGMVADPARSVAYLLFPDNDMRSCSGFLVGRDRIMTNHHCIALSTRFSRDGKSCADVVIELDYLDKGTPLTLRCVDAISNKDLDIAVLRIAPEDVKKLKGRPILALASAASLPSPATLIHHPAGMPMRLSHNCIAAARTSQSKVQHTCNTLGGSSGSPLLNSATEVIGVQSDGIPDMLLSEYQRRVAKGEIFYNLAVDAKLIPKQFREFK